MVTMFSSETEEEVEEELPTRVLETAMNVVPIIRNDELWTLFSTYPPPKEKKALE